MLFHSLTSIPFSPFLQIANEEFEATESKSVRLLRYLCYAGGMLLMYKIVNFSASYH